MNKKKGIFIALILIMTGLMTGCVGSVITGATMVYDRHNLYKKFDSFQLGAKVRRALYYKDTTFKCKYCYLDVEVFNGDLLIAGHLPTLAYRKEAENRISKLSGFRREFIHIGISKKPGTPLEDSWITAKIRSGIFADSSINPKKFNIVTVDGIVYLMGDVDPAQAKKVINIARMTSGVRRVVKMFKYYHLTDNDQIAEI